MRNPRTRRRDTHCLSWCSIASRLIQVNLLRENSGHVAHQGESYG
jgi:hypothetical protein